MLKEILSVPTQIAYPAIAIGGNPIEIEIAHFIEGSNFKTSGLYFCLFTALAADVDVQLVAYPAGPSGLVQPSGQGQFTGSTALGNTALASTNDPGNLYTTASPFTLAIPGIRVVARFSTRGGNGTVAASVTIAAGAVLLPT